MSSISRTDLAEDGLVHDLNNVFQTILQAAHLISCDDDQRANADIITRGVERARRILGMAEAGEWTRLFQVVESAAAFVHDYVDTNGGPALIIVDSVHPEILVAHSTALERALINLFLNAAQAGERAHRKSVEVRVDGHFEQGALVFSVADDGPGIPEAMLPHLFTAHTRAEGYSGLGLSVVEQFVQGCSGAMTIANSASGGAVFTIGLPATCVKLAELPSPKSVLAERIPR